MAKFSHKHHEDIAGVIRGNLELAERVGAKEVKIGALSTMDGLDQLFTVDNPNFDSPRFRRACMTENMKAYVRKMEQLLQEK